MIDACQSSIIAGILVSVRSLDHCTPDQITVPGVLSALADPTRLEIARVLSDGQEHVQADFAADVSQSTLSHHMKRLRQAGVARSRPDGTRCYVTLRPELEQRFPGLLASILAAADRQPSLELQQPAESLAGQLRRRD
jgi:DNA-binding transcriptional ArsR family regulator